ncbi:TRAP-type C4-dicarboxylate transport system permease small subunit [Bacillus pakistanensis]|uniref:TRAP-type C4-dicarboxylate transport system permease small subunit n=1 Tax=Rossellomorea pakistanensis TaxID=992288 RepID=A0ABS2NDZ5_9BACI|nr:hypothetical protein [Bacillus pakistanensis]MBM7586079.1 TRAP-type C4-dicarboxylate transport system permease small subunit [Bacillus pakistanensis]
MEANSKKILDVVKKFAGIGCAIGIAIFVFSLFASGYNENYVLSYVGATIAFNAILVFLIGVFFVVTEEMIGNTRKGKKLERNPFQEKKPEHRLRHSSFI